MLNFRKMLFPAIAIILLWVMLFFKYIFQDTLIQEIGESIYHSRYIFLIVIFAGIASVFSFKNRIAIYSLLIKIELILCYLGFASRIIIGNIQSTDCLSIILMIIFSLLYFFLLFLLFILKDESIETKPNIFSPINKYSKLYESRKLQAETLMRLITGNESELGCSICISAEWGSGKTSFINSVIDELKSHEYANDNKEDKPQNYKMFIDEIRINAMELDNLESLVKYFFARIKSILKANDVYIGINSEYQELMSSMVGTIIEEKIGDFIKNKLSSNSDYRQNLSKINNLIRTTLKNRRIVIIVDDIERCTEEKIMEFLFFTKEIAMLNQCVVIFLTDCSKLVEIEKIDEEVLEKFFNYRINLKKVDSEEILKASIDDDCFMSFIRDSEDLYKQRLELAEEEYENRLTDNEKNKKEELTKIRYMYNDFINKIHNPRKILRSYSKFKELMKAASYSESNTEYNAFLNKVNYKTQIFILSLLYGFYLTDFEFIEKYGVNEYSKKFVIDIFKKFPEEKRERNSVDLIAENEWSTRYISREDNIYIRNEKFRFIHYLLSDSKELYNIANGHISKRDEYIEQIKSGKKPEESLEEVLQKLLLYSSKLSEQEKNIICQSIDLYKDEYTLDNIVELFNSQTIESAISENMWLLKEFYNKAEESPVCNDSKTKNAFINFAQNALRKVLLNVTNFVTLFNEETTTQTNTSEIVYHHDKCSDMLQAYCSKLIENYKLPLNLNNDTNPLKSLKDITQFVINKYERYYETIPDDIKLLCDKSEETLEFVEYLFKFEKLFQYDINVENQFEAVGENDSDKLNDILQKISKCNSENIRKYLGAIITLFNDIFKSCATLSDTDLCNIEKIISEYYKKSDTPPVPLRNIQLKILKKQKNIK